MKILFAEPQVRYPNKVHSQGRAEVGIRLNYALLASYLRQEIPETEVRIQPYRLLDFLDQDYDITQDIQESDVVCVGASTAEAKSAREILGLAKSLGKITIAGGIFPTSNPDYFFGSADYIVKGEGEQVIVDIVRALERGEVPRVRRRQLENIDLQPAYDLLPMDDYREHVKGIIYSARGCNNACDFCTVSPHWEHHQRLRSIDSVVEELRYYRDNGFTEVNFKDESLTQNRERLVQLIARIKAEDLGLTYKAKSGIAELDEEILGLLRAAGFVEIHTGVESITQSFDKGISEEQVRRKIAMALDYGFVVNPSFILGLPGQTQEDLRQDADFMIEIGRDKRVKVYTCMYTPHPSSKISSSEEIRIVSDDLDDYNHVRLVALPVSLEDSFDALQLLYETQKRVVREVGGIEMEVDVEKILSMNPSLEDVRLREVA
ncbi:MAG: radical SAM protein [archaeon]